MIDKIGIIDALYITITSMAVVFLTLIVIALILNSFKGIFKQKEKPEIKEIQNKEIAITKEEEEEKIIVALAASIMAGDGKINPNLRIKSITKIS